MVAVAAEDRLNSLLKPALFQIENDDDRDERDHDCEREQNGLDVIAHPSEKHGVRRQNTRARRSLTRRRRSWAVSAGSGDGAAAARRRARPSALID